MKIEVFIDLLEKIGQKENPIMDLHSHRTVERVVSKFGGYCAAAQALKEILKLPEEVKMGKKHEE